MPNSDALRASDTAAVARYLHVRGLLHDRHLARVERLILERYRVTPTRHLHSSYAAHVRTGFVRPGEGELWPVAFTTTVEISVALCVELSAERVAELGTTLNGPRRIRHRSWEDWWGWEKPLGQVCEGFFELEAGEQEEAIARWYGERLEWLANGGLLMRRTG
jgi:hypothetical protein